MYDIRNGAIPWQISIDKSHACAFFYYLSPCSRYYHFKFCGRENIGEY